MADETLLLELDIGGDSADAQAAVQETADALSALQDAIQGIDPGPLDSIDEASVGAATSTNEAGSAASGAAGEFGGLSGTVGDTVSGFSGLTGQVPGLSAGLGSVSDVVTGLAAGFSGIAIAAGGVAAGFIGLGMKAGEWANEQMRLMSILGLSAEQADFWTNAMEIAGGSADNLIMANRRLAVELDKAAEELASGGEVSATTSLLVDRLGVSVTDASGNVRTFSDIFPELADRIGSIENPTERASISQQLFGRGAQTLSVFFDHYNEIMPLAQKNTEDFGEGMDDPTSAAIKYNYEMNRMNEQMEELYTKVGPPFLIFLIAVVNGITAVVDAVESVVGWFRRHREAAVQLMDALLLMIPVVGQVALIAVEVKQHWEELDTFFSGLPGKFRDYGSRIIEGLWEGIESKRDWIIGKVEDLGGDILGGLRKGLGKLVPGSPSAYGIEVGEGLGLGIAAGIGNATADAIAAVGDLGAQTAAEAGLAGAAAAASYVDAWTAGLDDLRSAASGALSAISGDLSVITQTDARLQLELLEAQYDQLMQIGEIEQDRIAHQQTLNALTEQMKGLQSELTAAEKARTEAFRILGLTDPAKQVDPLIKAAQELKAAQDSYEKLLSKTAPPDVAKRIADLQAYYNMMIAGGVNAGASQIEAVKAELDALMAQYASSGELDAAQAAMEAAQAAFQQAADANQAQIDQLEALIEAQQILVDVQKDAIAADEAQRQALQGTIAAIQESIRQRHLEREIMVLQAELREKLLPTDAQMLVQLSQHLTAAAQLRDIYGDLADGTYDPYDAAVLAQLGFEGLAGLLLQIFAGIVSPTLFGSSVGAAAGAVAGAVVGGGGTAGGTVVHLHVNGPLMADAIQAQQFAEQIGQLLQRRQGMVYYT